MGAHFLGDAVALSRPVDHCLPFSTRSLCELAEFLVAAGVVDYISHEGLRVLLRDEGVSFQVNQDTKKWTEHQSHAEQNTLIRCYVAWRPRDAKDEVLRELVKRAKRRPTWQLAEGNRW